MDAKEGIKTSKPFTPWVIAQRCPVCNGFGTLKYGTLVCNACNGKGYILIRIGKEETRG